MASQAGTQVLLGLPNHIILKKGGICAPCTILLPIQAYAAVLCCNAPIRIVENLSLFSTLTSMRPILTIVPSARSVAKEMPPIIGSVDVGTNGTAANFTIPLPDIRVLKH